MKIILGSPMQLMATESLLFMPPENEPACVEPSKGSGSRSLIKVGAHHTFLLRTL